MQRHKFLLYVILSFLIIIAIVFGILYSKSNKKTNSKNGINQQISVDSSSVTISSDEPVRKVQINETNRIVVSGTVDELLLDATTGRYTLLMLLKRPDLSQQKILVELGATQYRHLVRYNTPKGEKNTIEEVQAMDSIAPMLTKGKIVQIEISIYPEIETFWNTFTTTSNTNTFDNAKRDEIFRVVLPSVISIKI